ncbi:proline--tRNA ligase [Patescibacteria group bacterium]|nr:proline--tRNA ligase [Patescibacteria group bacterium]
MIISQSKLFGKTQKETPKDAVTPSHQLLLRAGYIDQLAAGIWSLLPLGFRVHKNIEQIIREEMESVDGQEIFLPTMQPKKLWQETGRWETIDPPLFVLKDRHGKQYGLGPTHEEVITDLARRLISSYKQLPLSVFQIQNKFRNEVRSTGGLLRVREFVMKDLYSFHSDDDDLDNYYQKVHQAYHRIFKRCGLEAVSVEAESGSIGGNYCHEFMVIAESGEDQVCLCQKCDWAANADIVKTDNCPKCKSQTQIKNTIEAGHIFKLGDTYSAKMKANYVDQQGKNKPVKMGCYGIGLGRLMATIIEASHDQDGIIWPETVSPFSAHLLTLSQDKKVSDLSTKMIEACQQEKLDILYDDREISPANKLKDADLIGITKRVVISTRSVENNTLELKFRNEKKVSNYNLPDLIKKLKV